METYQYPDTIKNHTNASRSLSFYIYDHSNIIKSVTDSYEEALDKKSSLMDKAEAVGKTVAEVAKNLLSNEVVTDAKKCCVITLPLPNTFNDSQTHGWNQQKSLIGDIGTSLANHNIADNSMTEYAGIGAGVYSAVKNGDGVSGIMTKGLIGGLAGKALRKANISVDAILANAANNSGQRKPIVDPGYFQNYTGSTPRNFNLKYDLVPNSKEEAEQILMIIAKFKQYSSPSQISSSPMLSAPFHFKITNSNSYLNLLTGMDMMVLTSISVDYGADGAMEMFGDGMPKHISLSLSFAENRVRTAEDYSTVPDTSTLGYIGK